MTSEWKEYKLKDVCIKITDGSHYSPKATELGYPMLSVKDMQEFGFSYTNCKYITEQDFVKMQQNDCVPLENDILVAKDGSYLKHIFICKKNKQEAILSSIALFRPNTKIINPNFLCYLLKSPNIYNYIKLNCVSGSALPRIILKDFKNITIGIPPLETQQKIAKVLSAIDDKIELNNSINNNLEQQAQAIFKSWFIDNEYEIEKETVIGEVCKCELGGTPSRNKKEYWDGSIAWINSGTVNNYRITKATEYITELGLSKSATKLLPQKTTVLAITGATLGQISLLEIDSCANQSVVGILENEKVPYEFIYPYICHNIHELLSHQTGGAQQHINKQNIEQLAISLPKHDVICKYKKYVNPIYSKITNNCFENEQLAQLRDTLLPKLMSGEIDVSKVEIDNILENQSADKLLFSEDK